MQEKKYYILYLICLLFVIQAISSCVHRQTEFFNVSDAPLHNTVLKDIATLMIPQPDSALNLIIAVSDTLDESKMTPFDYYEYQVLVSEVLYKNNYSLTNDSALYEAVEYYDSMVAVYPDNIDLQYQQARACYYKGASEEEKENTVEACICYLKSLEIIETIADKNPERKDLCHFKALTYNRLADIYLYCDALNISIECFRNAISCFESENKLYATAINNKKIGDLLYQMKEYDSAMLYLKKADSLCNLAKYNPVLKRDIDKSMAMVLFSSCRDKSSAYSILYQAMSQHKENDEQMAEYFILGNFYYEDKQYDSALYYLEKSFPHNKYTMFEAANLIVSICKITGDNDKIDFYSHYFMDAAQEELNKTIEKIELASLYEQYKQKKLEVRHQYQRRVDIFIIILVVITAVITRTVLVILLYRRKKIYGENISNKDSIISRMSSEMEDMSTDLKDKDNEIRSKNNEIEDLKEDISSKDFFIKTISGKVKKMSSDLKDKDNEIKSLKEKNNNDNELKIMNDALFEEKMQALLSSPECTNLFSRLSDTSVKVSSEYPELQLSDDLKDDIILSVDKVFDNFSKRLLRAYSHLNKSDIIYCCLFLIGLDEKHISALMGKDYSTVWRRTQKLQKIFGSSEKIMYMLIDLIKDGKI